MSYRKPTTRKHLNAPIDVDLWHKLDTYVKQRPGNEKKARVVDKMVTLGLKCGPVFDAIGALYNKDWDELGDEVVQLLAEKYKIPIPKNNDESPQD